MTDVNEKTLYIGDKTPIEVVSVSDIGNVRESNQDSFCSLLPPNTARGISGVLAVADGMGGHAGGEVASQTAIKLVVKHLSRQGVDFVEMARQAQSIPDVLTQVVESVNREVYKLSHRPELRGMGTTLTLGAISASSLILAHVGDSRAYLKRGESFRQLTVDDTWIREEVERGAIPAESAASHPRRNLLTQAIGLDRNVTVRVSEFSVRNGDLLLLCSDGLTESMRDDEIARILNPDIDKSSRELLKKALRSSGSDNITFVIAKVANTLYDARTTSSNFSDETISIDDYKSNRRSILGVNVSSFVDTIKKLLPARFRGDG